MMDRRGLSNHRVPYPADRVWGLGLPYMSYTYLCIGVINGSTNYKGPVVDY